jgi:hypothetical protein
MKYRDLRGAINRAKFVYAMVQYAPGHTFYTKVSKEAARELADEAKGAAEGNVTASEDAGDLYIGVEPAGLQTEDGEESEDDDE